jgi:pseudouridine-5'-phosphate glycosidase
MSFFKLKFNHSSLIGVTLELEAWKEHALELRAKTEAGIYKGIMMLNKIKKDTAMDASKLAISELAKDNISFQNDIITRKTINGTLTETSINMAKKLRWSKDHLPYILDNIRRNTDNSNKYEMLEKLIS